MAATDGETRGTMQKLKPVGWLIGGWFALILAFQNCGVDMSKNTFGASSTVLSCSPSAVELAAFEPVLNQTLQSTSTVGGGKDACGKCHNSNSNSSAKNTFTVFPGNTTTTPSLIQTNLCNVKAKGTPVSTHPQSSGHGGPQYSSSDIQDLVNFIGTYVR